MPQTEVIKIKGGSKMWLGEDGIIRIEMGKVVDEEVIKSFREGYAKLVKEPTATSRVLLGLGEIPHTPSSMFRKNMAKIVKDSYKNQKFEKIAFWGGRTIQKTVLLFVLATVRLKSIKYFNTEEEAIKWLKGD